MIKLQLKDGSVVTSTSKDAYFNECECKGVKCRYCPFNEICVKLSHGLTFGEAMEVCDDEINSMVDFIEDTTDYNILGNKKKTYTFEFTDEQAMYLHAFMNIFEPDEIEHIFNKIEFFDEDEPPFVKMDINNIPEAWYACDMQRTVKVMHALSYEIYNKLNEQRKVDAE